MAGTLHYTAILADNTKFFKGAKLTDSSRAGGRSDDKIGTG
jgi:hypothetical protein